MKCPDCKQEIKPKLSTTDIHRKTKEWNCPKCGLIRSQYIVDGEVMREWNRDWNKDR